MTETRQTGVISMWNDIVTTEEELRKRYALPVATSLIKEIDHVSQHYRAFIERSPFVIVATSGPEGLDCSPRGDAPGFVRVHDSKTLLIPDRPGNNRLDSLRNVIANPGLSLLFLIPGVGETLRVIGHAAISLNAELVQSFAVSGKPPRSVVVVHVSSVYFQCSKAIVRSRLWDERVQIDRTLLPSVGTILDTLSKGQFGGSAYDQQTPDRIKANLY